MAEAEKTPVETCGIVMPISAMDGYTESHWSDVLDILQDAIRSAGFDPNLVSSADDVGVIQKRIIQNLYENPIVICDVSGKNSNVMFELGMRLAFDKPTIIVKDDKTTYSFDTAPIEHISYPKDLRFHDIVTFKQTVTDKVKSTYAKSKSDKNFTPFLGHFGTFKVAKIEAKEVSGDEFIIDQLRDIRQQLSAMKHQSRRSEGEVLIGREGSDVTRFTMDAKRAIRRFSKENGVPLRDLSVMDEAFWRFVEDESKARDHLRSHEEFMALFRVILATMQL
jgi:hypothetical protein